MRPVGLLLAVSFAWLPACASEEPADTSAAGGVAGAHHAAGAGGALATGGVSAGGSGGTATGGVAAGGDSGAAGTPSALCDLGSMYPTAPLIDPDAPVYQGANWTQQLVDEAFAKAKADQTTAYLGYAAARDHEKYMQCAFCSCGCGPSIGHLSAIDCFKDMHGFT